MIAGRWARGPTLAAFNQGGSKTASIKLTDAERLILANQYEILGVLNKDEFAARLADNLRDGHVWIYSAALRARLSDELSVERAEMVLAVLGVYSSLKDSFDNLSDQAGIDPHRVVFPGFDGNNESELLSFTAALSKNGNYAQTIGEHAKNSHMPMVDMYERMLKRWDELGKPGYPLTKLQIIDLLDAQIHPSNRK